MEYTMDQAIALQSFHDNLARFFIALYYDLETYNFQVQQKISLIGFEEGL